MNTDALISSFDHALRTLFAPTPASGADNFSKGVAAAPALQQHEISHAAGLMRVNHVGEVCAQALYMGQALTTKNRALSAHFISAAGEEGHHLAWTAQRLTELGSRPSVLNPLWYAGAFALGALASSVSDETSLGFVMETERQVQAHLQSHLAQNNQALPARDAVSRAIVQKMHKEEAAHAKQAQQLGGKELPAPVKWAMGRAAKVMTTTAYYV